ncbi:MAG: hypothetical protein HOA19_00265 [Candidatus Marinimicrobia bacterium]|nr:hypothetical protein [Candidatus Neomarinimicrobiota bacterium]
MKIIKLILSVLFVFSFGFSEHRKNKTHKHKKHRKHKVHHVVKYHKPRIHIGANWRWNHWDHWIHDCGVHQRVLVVKETEDNNKHETVLQIIEEIEKLAELKEKRLITEEEYQKKKKELLKRI